MDLEIAVLSKAGGRERNEDACGYWISEDACCWVVSDGAGGHGGGDVASKLAVSSMLTQFAVAPSVSGEAIRSLLSGANEAILQRQRTEAALGDMRATGAVLLIDRPRAHAMWGHIGDTRLYCFRDERVLLQTRDHSVIQQMFAEHRLDAAISRQHPQRNVLLHALGSADDFAPAVQDMPFPLLQGDVFLLCSDGLWEYVDEASMCRLLGASASAQDWLSALEQELLQRARPGHDNYSGVVVRIGRCAG
jgi:serine/threonine protein phosphatase PrpC